MCPGESCFHQYKEAFSSLKGIQWKAKCKKSIVWEGLHFPLASALQSSFLLCKINILFTDAW